MVLNLDECNARLAWAKRHLQRLDEAVTAYKQSDPFTTRQESDAARYTASLYVSAEPVPLEVSFMAGDVLHNLSSTLDHLAWQLALMASGPSPSFPIDHGTSWRRIFFPLREEPSEGDKWLSERLRDVGPEFKAFLQQIQPYVASDDPKLATLWMLNELSNVDKHRVALTAVPTLHAWNPVEVETPLSRVNVQKRQHAFVPTMLKSETLLAQVWFDSPPLAAPILTMDFDIWVDFDGDLGIQPGMPVVGTLDNCAAMVDYILIRAKRLGEAEASS